MKNISKDILLILFSICCGLVCIKLYVIKEKQADRLLELRMDISQGYSQSDLDIENTVLFEEKLNESKDHLRDRQDEFLLLQLKYDLISLLEEKSNEDENPYAVYEKYLQLKQGELARIEEDTDLSEWGRLGFLNGHFSGVTFSINKDMMIQYRNENNVWEYLLPRCLIITSSDMNMGFMNARAGMNFEEIQQNAYEEEIIEGFMYWYEQEVYYIRYIDGYYEYIFLSDYQDGRDSWLIISKIS